MGPLSLVVDSLEHSLENSLEHSLEIILTTAHKPEDLDHRFTDPPPPPIKNNS